jgi:hypothetical protein
MSSAYAVVLHRLLYLNLKFSSANLSHFSYNSQASGAIMYLLEPRVGGGGVKEHSPLLLFNPLGGGGGKRESVIEMGREDHRCKCKA